MAAGTYDFTIEQGATFQRVLTWTDALGNPWDLTGYTARMMIRTTYADDDTGSPVKSLTSGAGITLGGTAGTITLLISATDTALIPVPGTPDSNYRYDLEIQSSGGTVYRLLQGEVTISKEVTR